MDSLIRKHAIQNRLKFGKAHEKAVLGSVLAEKPELKKDVKRLVNEIEKIVLEVNGLKEEELDTYKKEEKEHEKKPELSIPGSPEKVVMRFAPNPNGPPTIGHARGIITNSELARKYNGKFILRFDDTDARVKPPLREAYQWYLEDCKWLGAKPDKTLRASERLPEYYGHVRDLIGMSKAYVCFCSQEEFKKLKDSSKACPDRDTTPGRNLEKWDDMLDGKYNEHEAVLRIKTDLESKDPALRDWVAFRIIETEHPIAGDKYRVWPMLDFESAIEDHLHGITHIIRGKDLIDSEKRQRYIYKYLGWKYPSVIHWGMVKLDEFGKISTAQIKKGIDEGRYTGWDDPKLPTIRALKRRGILPEAIRNFILELGLSDSDISLSMETLYAENRKLVDDKANRYFFVEDPVELTIEDMPPKTFRMLLHPSFRDRGFREYPIKADNDKVRLFISKGDSAGLKKGDTIRLIGLYNVEITKETPLEARCARKPGKVKHKIHWVQDFIDAEIITPKNTVTGYCETLCKNLKIGEIIQFERFGFVRLEKKNEKLVFCYGHR